MKVVISHLTRMQPGYICAAGIDLETGRHVRPVLGAGRLTTNFLKTNGGFFALAHLLDLGQVDYKGEAPELEDYRFDPGKVASLGPVSAGRFWNLLKKHSCNRFIEIFGPALHPHWNSCVIEMGQGQASLGNFWPATPPELYLNERDHLRLLVSDGQFKLDLPVTDLHLYEADHKTPRREVIEQAANWCKSGAPLILSVGLSRPWQHPEDSAPRHWLQVNNLHFEHNPVW